MSETAAGQVRRGRRAGDPHHWFDDEAGPVVRPYAMTRGRTASPTRQRLDLIAVVVPEAAADDPGRDQALSPEHVEIVERCSEFPGRSPSWPPGWTCPWGWSASWSAISSRRNSSM